MLPIHIAWRNTQPPPRTQIYTPSPAKAIFSIPHTLRTNNSAPNYLFENTLELLLLVLVGKPAK